MKTYKTTEISKKFYIIVLSLFAVLFFFFGISNINNIGASAIIQYEDKIIRPIDDNIAYDDNKVLVVLDKNISKINKEHNQDLFGNFPKKEIVDLTVRENNMMKGDDFRQIFEITLPQHDKEKVKEAIWELEKIDGILSAEPSYNIGTSSIKSANDPYYDSNSQWALNGKNGINAPLAWSITTGSSAVRVGIIDTGIAKHPDLNENVVSGKDFYSDELETSDDSYGHGTMVAGIIGAIGNNSTGITGINWNVSLVPLQVLIPNAESDSNISINAVIKAIEYATDTYWADERIHILNYSVAGFSTSSAVLAAVKDYPGLFVWSAGNNGAVIDNAASYDLDNLISVGAIDSDSNRSVWNSEESSAYGNYVNIYAPGTAVRTTAINNSDEYFSGTSAAAPHVAGAAALLLSYDSTLSASAIKKLLINKADDIIIEGKYAKRLDIGSVLWSKKYPNNPELQNLGYFATGGGCNGTSSGWRIQVTNNRSINMRVIYNTKMCFEGDAKAWTELSDINYFELPAGESQIVEVEENGTATHIAFSYTVGNKRYITYANELDLSYNMINPNIIDVSYQNNGNINLVGKNGGDWIIDVKNNYNEVRKLEYNTKMCYLDDAKNWTGLNDINNDITLREGLSVTIRIEENLLAGVIAISLVNETENRRDIFYANNLNKNCTMDIYTNSISATQTEDNCVAAGTMITLADGSQKSVESLIGNEMLLVWNMYTGTFDVAPILFIDNDPIGLYEIIKLRFSDGTMVKVISEHGFWDFNLNGYVYLDENASRYIGHWFNKQIVNADGTYDWTKVQLIGVEIAYESTMSYSPVTYEHLCYYVNGMLSMPGGIDGFLNIFEVDDENMRYNIEAMNADIEQYGLFTYEELNEIVPVTEEIFEAVNGKYLKISIGKGLIDVETLCALVDRYSKLF